MCRHVGARSHVCEELCGSGAVVRFRPGDGAGARRGEYDCRSRNTALQVTNGPHTRSEPFGRRD
jgi:hypothetical protein